MGSSGRTKEYATKNKDTEIGLTGRRSYNP
jgi:hypothetical protein